MRFKIFSNKLNAYVDPSEYFVNGNGEVFFFDLMEGELVKGKPEDFKIVPLVKFTYRNIINDDGTPDSKWVTQEEYDKIEKQIQSYIDCLRSVVGNINKQEGRVAPSDTERLDWLENKLPLTHAFGKAPSNTWQIFGKNGDLVEPSDTLRGAIDQVMKARG